LFLETIASALQLDRSAPTRWPDVKAAITPDSVREIHEAVLWLWPDLDDLGRVLDLEATESSGLYVGNYHAEALERCLARHALYSESILLLDPFMHPLLIREEMNPLVHPEQHMITTAQAAGIWLAMAPWVEKGLVRFIRCPADFSIEAFRFSLGASTRRQERHPELLDLLDTEVKRMIEEGQSANDLEEFYRLSHPDEFWTDRYREAHPAATSEELENLLREIRRRREWHPYFLEQSGPDSGRSNEEIIKESAGTSYEMAKIVANRSRSHMITDMRYRWMEMEMDRRDGGVWRVDLGLRSLRRFQTFG